MFRSHHLRAAVPAQNAFGRTRRNSFLQLHLLERHAEWRSCGRAGRLTLKLRFASFSFPSCNYLRLFAVNERKDLCVHLGSTRDSTEVSARVIPVHTSGTARGFFVKVQPHGDNDARSHPSASDLD